MTAHPEEGYQDEVEEGRRPPPYLRTAAAQAQHSGHYRETPPMTIDPEVLEEIMLAVQERLDIRKPVVMRERAPAVSAIPLEPGDKTSESNLASWAGKWVPLASGVVVVCYVLASFFLPPRLTIGELGVLLGILNAASTGTSAAYSFARNNRKAAHDKAKAEVLVARAEGV